MHKPEKRSALLHCWIVLKAYGGQISCITSLQDLSKI